MSSKDVAIITDSRPDVVAVKLDFKSPKFSGHDACFEIFSEVDVHDSSGVNDKKTHFSKDLKIGRDSPEFEIPKHSIPSFSFKGKMIDISLHYQLKIDDGIFSDTTIKGSLLEDLIIKPTVNSDARKLIEPKDVFKFFKNLAAIPLYNQVLTIGLMLVGLIVMAVNTMIGVHDQFVPESSTYFYSHTDSDGDTQSPFFNSLFLSGAAGAAIWMSMKSQLRKYMKFEFCSPEGLIDRNTSLQVSQLIRGYSRVHLKDIVLRIVACNMEKGQYIRGSGSNRRTVSFSEPIRGVLLFEKKVSLIKRRDPVENAFPDVVDFKKMFDVLYPPNMISNTHGLDVYWEIQLIHGEFIDQELVGPVKCLKANDFYEVK